MKKKAAPKRTESSPLRIGVSPMVLKTTHEFFRNNFTSINAGTTYVLDSFPNLFRWTLNEAEKVLTPKEKKLIIKAFIGSVLIPEVAGDLLLLKFNTLIELYKDGPGMEGVDMNALKAKLTSLPKFTRVVLEIWAVNASKAVS